ncbi:MAG: OmpA family protein, partial [Proteobacteria bacterium]|nr:OmpA family protein [Pseudomonadota bacterium]
MRRASLLLTILLSTTLFACSSSKSGSANPGDGMETGDGNIPVAKPGSELSDVQFDFDSSALSAEAQQTLRNNGKYLVDTKKGVQIEGHCDERGTNEYNLA